MELAKTCLVIDARKTEKLSLDGPALRIRIQDQCSRLFPLRRMSRIHILGGLQHGLDALIYCAEHQIPVAFFTQQGKLRCQLYFPVLENTLISHWLEHVDFDPEAKQHYDDWLEYQSLNLMAQMGFRNGAKENRLQLINDHIRRHIKKNLGEKDYHLSQQWLDGILSVQLSQIIVNHGLGNQSQGKRKLMDDLLPLYNLWLSYQFLGYIQQRRITITGHSMSDFYQHQSAVIDFNVKRMLAQLSTRLESII